MSIYSEALRLGASQPWSKVLKTLTNETSYSAEPLIEYFKPLHDFLREENKRLADEDKFRQLLASYDRNASAECRKLKLAEWDKITDLNNEAKRDAYERAVKENGKYIKEQYNQHFRGLGPSNFTDEAIKRQISLLSKLGVNALEESRLAELAEVKVEMEQIYNGAEFCPWNKPNCTKKLTLDPGN